MYRKFFNMFSLLLVMAVAFSAVGPVSAQTGITVTEMGTVAIDVVPASPNGLYIVQMKQAPVVSYEGDVQGFSATKLNSGEKIDRNDADVQKYVDYLQVQHDAVVNKVGGEKVVDYSYGFNGFSARMTVEQANKLVKAEGVLRVTPDELRSADTSSTPTFLGLTDPRGLWKQLGGVGKAGEGIVIGIIDTGIWPESMSFSDHQNLKKQWTDGTGLKDKLVYKPLAGYTGLTCELDVPCNNKLIGAYYYNAGFGGDAGVTATLPWEYNSARDANGHGTHTASTSGGNNGVVVTGPAMGLAKTVSGIAPRARIVAYKALWTLADGTGSGYTTDLMDAIDQAIFDGVDVINYSISGSRTNFLDPVESMFMFAADRGIFVAASAGNSGPTASTVAHPSPWISTVAAGTHNREVFGTADLGGTTYTGASFLPVNPAAVTAPLIDSMDAGLAGADPTELALCFSTAWIGHAVLDPAKVAGKIVVCDRGTSDRVDKSLAVFEAGGVGMLLVNVTPNSIVADIHSVPTVHLQNTDRAAVKAFAATPGAIATINKPTLTFAAPAPFTASFSSRGPLQAGAGDLLKPDLMAPGQDILASVSPDSAADGREFDLYSGTSMSSPHVAGLAALMIDKFPSWSPMMIKSALMTTSGNVLDGPATDSSVIFSQGAGHVRPNRATDPGLVFNSDWWDWNAFLCGTTGISFESCPFVESLGYSLDPSDMNVPSISIGAMAGEQTVTRTVTNVSGRETYSFSYIGLDGITVTPAQPSFILNKGQSTTLSVTFTTNGAALNTYVGGYIFWRGSKGQHVVRIPVLLKPVAMGVPTEVNGDYDVTFGYTGDFTATPRGLIEPLVLNNSVSTGFSVGYQVSGIPALTYMRASLFDVDTTPGSDLDLRVYFCNPGCVLVGSSGNGNSDEEVNLTNSAAGTYRFYVDGYGTADPSSSFALHLWFLETAVAGNMSISAPSSVVPGAVDLIDLTFSGLTSGVRYLGSVAYSTTAAGVTLPNPTIVRYDAP
ncbi:MAG: S8 family peptidase [Chloroflexi bacterium]|nr:S8 family peptidase [Chloroflexota bacterium]